MNNTYCNTQKRGARGGSFHLSQKVDYGLFLLAALAGSTDNAPQSIRTIAKNGKMSFSFLQKVAHILKDAGLVCAVRGKVGGYKLNRPTTIISMKDVIEALDGKITVARCLSTARRESTRCPRQNFCTLRSKLRTMNSEIEDYYISKKLSDFLTASV